MMNQPKLCNDQHESSQLKNAKTDGTGFDFESILGRTDGTILAVGETLEEAASNDRGP